MQSLRNILSFFGSASGPNPETMLGTVRSNHMLDGTGKGSGEGGDAAEHQPVLPRTSSREHNEAPKNRGPSQVAGGRVDLARSRYDGTNAAGSWSHHEAYTHDSAARESGRQTRHARDPLENFQEKIHTLERENDCMRKELLVEKRESREARGEAFSLRKQNANLCRELDSARRHQAEYGYQQQELLAIKNELRRVVALHEVTRSQLVERTTELQDAQLFINQADSLSGADVIVIANTLNAEILQSAAFMADSLDYAGKQPEMLEAVENVRLLVGEDLTQVLTSKSVQSSGQDFDPTWVQLALQVCFVRCCKMIVESWTLRGEEGVLKDIYKNIFARDKQSVAGRWRSMTQAHATSPNGHHCSLQLIIQNAACVLSISGCSAQDTKILPNSFHERLSVINNLALRLRTATGEQVTSMDVVPFVIEAGSAFNPETMDDSYAENRGEGGECKVGERVAGSTELGLLSRLVMPGGQIHEAVMLKPKVILCSSLNEDNGN